MGTGDELCARAFGVGTRTPLDRRGSRYDRSPVLGGACRADTGNLRSSNLAQASVLRRILQRRHSAPTFRAHPRPDGAARLAARGSASTCRCIENTHPAGSSRRRWRMFALTFGTEAEIRLGHRAFSMTTFRRTVLAAPRTASVVSAGRSTRYPGGAGISIAPRLRASETVVRLPSTP